MCTDTSLCTLSVKVRCYFENIGVGGLFLQKSCSLSLDYSPIIARQNRKSAPYRWDAQYFFLYENAFCGGVRACRMGMR